MMKTLILALTLSGLCSPVGGQQLTHDELLEVLDIRSWRIPLPRDVNLSWGVELVDAKPRKVFSTGQSEWMHPSDKALITFRPNTGDTYRFTFKQRGGTSSGSMTISPCLSAEPGSSLCKDQYSIAWHDQPVRIDDGNQYLLADVESTFGEGRKKQLVLVLRKSRL